MTAITQQRYVRAQPQHVRYVAVKRPLRSVRGLGQSDGSVTYDVTTGLPTTLYDTSSTGSTPAASTSSINWGSILSNLISTAGKTAQVSITPLAALPAGSYYSTSPYGTTVATGAGASALSATALTSTLSSMLPLLLIGGGVLLVISMAGRK